MKRKQKKFFSFSLLNIFALLSIIVACLFIQTERSRLNREVSKLQNEASAAKQRASDRASVQTTLTFTKGLINAYWSMETKRVETEQASSNRQRYLKNALKRLASCEPYALSGIAAPPGYEDKNKIGYQDHLLILKLANQAINMLESNNVDFLIDADLQSPELRSFIQRMKLRRDLIGFLERDGTKLYFKGMGFYDEFIRQYGHEFDAWKENKNTEADGDRWDRFNNLTGDGDSP